MNFINLEVNYFIVVLLHLIISFILSYIYGSYLQQRYKDKKRNIIFFLFVFNFFLPMIGYVATIILAHYLVKVEYEQSLKNVELLDLNLFETNFIQVHRHFGEGLIQTVLLNEYISTDKKIMALVAISENISKHNINIIKMGLSSHDDEVRLYAFSILDSLEKDINTKIFQNLSEYKTSQEGTKKHAMLAKDLAFLYWELIYYELSEDVLLHYLLREVKHYALVAQKVLKNDVKISFLLGRVYMKENKYDRALTEFILTTELDKEMLPYTAPYICELYFLKRFFRPIKSIMKHTKNLELNTTLFPIVEQWRSS
jgi:tetratricopeptide (TPR) repeat protein